MAIKSGITGGIGSGKSYVSQILKKLGYEVYDSDSQAKRIMAESAEVKSFLIGALGESIYKGEDINKELLATHIFNDDELRQKLNNVIHPLVLQDFQYRASQCKKDIYFIESALIFESGFDRFLDKIISVSADEEVRINRVIKRENCQRDKVIERINSQMSQKEKDKKSDYLLLNDEKVSLLSQIEKIIKELNINKV